MFCEPLISVIIPVYNVEKYLNQCLDSVINQTYKNLEIVLINDGSTDKSGEICDYYSQKDDRITVIHKENGGQALARNIALEMIKGEVVAFVDSDDWIDPDMYSDMMSFMLEKNLDVVFCGAKRVTDSESVVDYVYYPDRAICDVDEVTRKLLTDEIGGHPCFKLYRRYCWDNVTFPEGRIFEDLAISFRPFLNAKNKIGFLEEPYYNYRMNPCGTCLKKKPNLCYCIYLAMKDHYEFSVDHFPELADKCMAGTVVQALQTITDYYKNNWMDHTKIMTDVFRFLDLNKRSVRGCYKFLTKKDRLKIRLYYFSKQLYKMASKLI